MIDIKFLRENPDAVKENIKKKFQDYKLPLVDQVIELDEQSRAVKKQADGYYVLINFEGEPDVIKEIDRVIKIHDTILKHLIVKIDE